MMLQLPPAGVAAVTVTLLPESVAVAMITPSGPLLVTVAVAVPVCPVCKGAGVLNVMVRSDTGFTTTLRVTVLFDVSVSSAVEWTLRDTSRTPVCAAPTVRLIVANPPAATAPTWQVTTRPSTWQLPGTSGGFRVNPAGSVSSISPLTAG
ncbi:MAG TPA: hypothetical protein VN755_13505, partial [Steroidobacteraceae bacterium]|nr:hypothetical protein [Steroidobacteraceae bacterium]